MNKKTTILLADDHALIRTAFRGFIANNDDFYLIDEAENGEELVEKYLKYEPDLLVVDISMPKMTGIEALIKIKNEHPNVKALFVSMHNEKEDFFRVYKAGGKGLLDKNITEDLFFHAIEEVLNNRFFFTGYKTKEELDNLVNEFEAIMGIVKEDDYSNIKLQPKERIVFELIGKGFETKDIAEKLHLSERTIELYRTRLRTKFNLQKNIKLQTFAFQYFDKQQIND